MREATRELVALIRAHQRRLEAVYRSMENALDGEIAQLGKTPISAFIVAGLLENYYTCLETIFLRISQSFDNNLDAARWHNDLRRNRPANSNMGRKMETGIPLFA